METVDECAFCGSVRNLEMSETSEWGNEESMPLCEICGNAISLGHIGSQSLAITGREVLVVACRIGNLIMAKLDKIEARLESDAPSQSEPPA